MDRYEHCCIDVALTLTYQSPFPSSFRQLHKYGSVRYQSKKIARMLKQSLGNSNLLLWGYDELRICISNCCYLIDSDVDLVKCEPSPHVTKMSQKNKMELVYANEIANQIYKEYHDINECKLYVYV